MFLENHAKYYLQDSNKEFGIPSYILDNQDIDCGFIFELIL